MILARQQALMVAQPTSSLRPSVWKLLRQTQGVASAATTSLVFQ